MRAIIWVAFFVMFAAVTPSSSDAAYWSQTGAACVPHHDTIRHGWHLVTAGTVKHAGGEDDRIYMNCGVEPDAEGVNPERLYLTYRDSSGSATADTIEVKAQLWSQSRTTGTTALLATVDSDSSAVTTDNQIFTSFMHTFDFTTHYYYVEVQLDRTSDSDDVILRGVALEDAP